MIVVYNVVVLDANAANHCHPLPLDELARRQLGIERLLIPNNMRRLIEPIPVRATVQFQIEMPEHMRDDEAHLMICETVTCV